MAASDSSPLYWIITKVDRQLEAGKGEFYLSLDARSKRGGSSLWGLLSGERHIYRVFTESAGKPPAEGVSDTLPIVDPETNDPVNISFAYQAFCPDGNEERLVNVLGARGDPLGALNAIIASSARSFLFGREQELFLNFEKVRDEAVAHVCDAVIEETGLRFRTELRVALEEELASFPLKEHVEVRFRDSHQAQELILQCDLDVVSQSTLRAVVTHHRLPELRNRLVAAAKDYFRHEVAAQAFADDLRDPSITSALSARFNEILKKDGREVHGLALVAKGRGLPERSLDCVLHEPVETLGRTKPITLTTKIQLTLADWAQFQLANEQNLEKWLGRAFHAVLRDVCFEKKYLEYLQTKSWDIIEADITAAMEAKAKIVGYRVKQIISRPELDENKFRHANPHPFEIKNLPLRSTSPTVVDLTVGVNLSITKWDDEGLAAKINQGVDLETDIEAELRHALTSVLIETIPNDFILNFSKSQGDEASIEQKLCHAVQKRLQDVYKADVFSVVVTQVDTDEVKRVKELMNEPHEVYFDVKPYGGGEDLMFSMTWKISDIQANSWEIIRRPFCNSDNIRDALRTVLQGTFSALNYNDLRYETVTQKDSLEAAAVSAAEKHIASHFGLVIALSNLRRGRTKGEAGATALIGETLDLKIEDKRAALKHKVGLRQEERKQELERVRSTNVRVVRDRERLSLLEARPPNDLTGPEQEELARLKAGAKADARDLGV